MRLSPKIMDALSDLLIAWRTDIPLFCEQVLEFSPTPQQREFLDLIVRHNRIACKSGHGTGKSTIMAACILWFLSVYPDAQVPATAPRSEQLKTVLWSRLWDLYGTMNPAFKTRLKLTATRVQNVFNKSTFCQGTSGRKENTEALQGYHAENLLVIVDEASGVHDDLFKPLQGALTQRNNKLVLIGNPTKRTGYFREAFQTGSGFATLTMNAEQSPIVTSDSIHLWEQEYGKDSDEYRVRVLGEFPLQDAYSLYSEDDILWAMQSPIVAEVKPIVWGVDVARFGDDRTVIAVRKGRAIIHIEEHQNLDTFYITDRLRRMWNNAPYFERPQVIFIDTIGIGAGVFDNLRSDGLPVEAIVANAKALEEHKFYNKKSEMYVNFERMLKSRLVQLPDNKVLRDELLAIRYSYQKNRYVIQSKAELKKDFGRSPDMAEAVIFCFSRHIYEADKRTIRYQEAYDR